MLAVLMVAGCWFENSLQHLVKPVSSIFNYNIFIDINAIALINVIYCKIIIFGAITIYCYILQYCACMATNILRIPSLMAVHRGGRYHRMLHKNAFGSSAGLGTHCARRRLIFGTDLGSQGSH